MSSQAMSGDTAILYRMPSGIAGDVIQKDKSWIETGFFNASYVPTAFGGPVKLVSGLFRAMPASAVAADLYGFLVRQAPAVGSTTIDANGNSTAPNAEVEQGILVKGYLNVLCPIGTPARGGKVYMRVVADTGKAVGALEATSDVTFVGGVITGTGTGTIAGTATQDAVAGTWYLELQTTSQTSKVTVIDPNGIRHDDATVGSAYSSQGFAFTISAAGTMTAGDHFHPVVTKNNVTLPDVLWAVDGCDANYNTAIRVS